MTKYNELNVTASTNKKRVGRGISAGGGKTAGRGTKGQNSRTGKKLRATFQGGQRAIMQAVPKKRGFRSFRVPAQIVYLDRLNGLSGIVDNHSLYEAGLIETPYHKVKVIARGELTSKISLRVQSASKSVIESIAKKGGSFESIPTPLMKKKDSSEK